MSEPSAFVTVNLTLYVPTFGYSYVGFCSVLLTDPVFSKSHSQLVGKFVDESVNVTDSGAAPETGDPKKSATGTKG